MGAAVTQYSWALYYASEKLRNDREIVMTVVMRNGWALRYVSEEMRNDREIVTAAATQDGGSLKYASEILQRDKNIVVTALRNIRCDITQYIHSDLFRDPDFIKEIWHMEYVSHPKLNKCRALPSGLSFVILDLLVALA